jgi:nitrate/TMAO reductase-like tetraheme cytochrome c subunit
MAERVWERMKDRDSKECRNCHDFKTMDPAKQKDRSVTKHEGAIEDGKTCIDCHKGIAHKPVHLKQDPASTASQQLPAAGAAAEVSREGGEARG